MDFPSYSNPPLVSCIIPTLNRPALLSRTLIRLFESTQGIDVEAVVVIDESMESLEFCVGFAKEHRLVIDFSPARRGAIHCWNLGLKHSHAEIVFHQGDDIYYEDDWLKIALDSFQGKLNNYGLLGVNDQMHNGNQTVATHVLFDKAFCRAELGGVMANPRFRYYCVDSWLNERARRAGRFYWEEESRIKHIHPANGLRAVDDTDRSHGDDAWNHDIPLMEQMRGAGLPIDFDPII